MSRYRVRDGRGGLWTQQLLLRGCDDREGRARWTAACQGWTAADVSRLCMGGTNSMLVGVQSAAGLQWDGAMASIECPLGPGCLQFVVLVGSLSVQKWPRAQKDHSEI